jgi:1-deoxy-D-xylulose-5-phosphate synthase
VIRFSKGAVPADIPAVNSLSFADVLVAQTNPDVCIVAVGAMATTALESAKTLQASGYSVEVLDPIQVLPVNAGLIEYLSDRDYVVTIEDGLVDGGIGEAIGSALRANNSATRLMSLGIPKRFLDHASRKSILQKLHLDAQGIAATIEQGLKSKVR